MPTITENDVPVVDSGEKASIFNDYFVAQGRLPGADTLPPFVHLHPSAREFFTISVEEEEIFRLMQNVDVTKASLRTKVDQKDSPQEHPPSNTFMTGRVGQNQRNDGRQGDNPHCVKNATKRIKLIVLIVSNVEEETTLPDIAGRETRGGYP